MLSAPFFGRLGVPRERSLYSPFHSHRILAKAAPRPLLRGFDQTALHRVAMHVAQFLNALALGVDVEIVIAALPERFAVAQMTGDGLFECLHRFCERFRLRFGHEEMDVLRHDDITEYVEFVMFACLFEGAFAAIAGSRSTEAGLATVTTEGEEVQVAGVLKAMEAPRHGWIVGGMGERGKITLVGEGWWATGFTHPSFARMGHPAEHRVRFGTATEASPPNSSSLSYKICYKWDALLARFHDQDIHAGCG